MTRIKINGEIYQITETWHMDYEGLHQIVTEEGEEFILAKDSEAAGKAARERWEDMAKHDPAEFTCLVGEQTLVAWALVNPAGPGSSKVCSLDEWLDLWLDTPEEEWAGYDHGERQVERVGKLTKELGFTPTVAYRCN